MLSLAIVHVIISIVILVRFSIAAEKESIAMSTPAPEANSLFYHEDDYCQIELVPEENFDRLIRQAENVEDFAAKHFTGQGYTDMMIRDEHAFPLRHRGIRPAELDEILSGLALPRHDQVSTGIRPGEMPCVRTIGFGENYHAIFYDYESDIVDNIWLDGPGEFEPGKLIQVLHQIGVKWRLLLMDWNSLELIDLSNLEQLKKYLS